LSTSPRLAASIPLLPAKTDHCIFLVAAKHKRPGAVGFWLMSAALPALNRGGVCVFS
jgi:hypothetical protein